MIRSVKIGDFIDACLDGGLDYRRFEVLCFGLEDHECAFRPIKQVIRHPLEEKLYEITTVCGRTVRVTSSHSVFVWEDGEKKLKRGDEIRPGDYVLAPARLPFGRRRLVSRRSCVSVPCLQAGRAWPGCASAKRGAAGLAHALSVSAAAGTVAVMAPVANGATATRIRCGDARLLPPTKLQRVQLDRLVGRGRAYPRPRVQLAAGAAAGVLGKVSAAQDRADGRLGAAHVVERRRRSIGISCPGPRYGRPDFARARFEHRCSRCIGSSVRRRDAADGGLRRSTPGRRLGASARRVRRRSRADSRSSVRLLRRRR